jgi:hypothetical protein
VQGSDVPNEAGHMPHVQRQTQRFLAHPNALSIARI